MYKLIASDIDRTIMNEDGIISAFTIKNIEKARQKNIIIVMATGRIFTSTNRINLQYDLADYLICCNGSYIYDCLNEEVIYENSFFSKNLDEIVNMVKEKAKSIYFGTRDCWYQYLENSYYGDNHDIVEIKDISSFVKSAKVYKIEVNLKDVKDLELLEDKLKESFPNEKVISVKHSNRVYWLEIIPNQLDKGVGLEYLCRFLGINMNEVLAFGDSENDIEMLEKSGYGVAVENANLKVKEIANEVCDSCNNDGVGHFIEENI